jgi:septal ring-binding cell division protein DamX
MHADIAKIPSSFYAIQIVASSDLKKVRNLYNSFLDQEELLCYQTFYNNTEWFVLLKGRYKTYYLARQAMDDLLVEYKKWNPFVVSFYNIKDKKI